MSDLETPFDSLEVGATLGFDGEAQFTMDEDGEWVHIALGIPIDTTLLSRFYEDGEISLTQDEETELKLSEMDREEFTGYIDAQAPKTMLTLSDHNFEKTAEGTWLGDGAVLDSTVLFMMKDSIVALSAPEEVIEREPIQIDEEALRRISSEATVEEPEVVETPEQVAEVVEDVKELLQPEAPKGVDHSTLFDAPTGYAFEYEGKTYTRQLGGEYTTEGVAKEYPPLYFYNAVSEGLIKPVQTEVEPTETAVALPVEGTLIRVGADEPASTKLGTTGGEFSADDIEAAVEILEGYDGKLFRAELRKQGNALGDLDFNEIVGFYKDKLEGKAETIKHLRGLLV